MWWILAACGPPPPACPAGTHVDEQRTARLIALAELSARPVCFGDVPDGGVVDPDGVAHLDPDRDDRWLAARLAHLARHGDVPSGPDCVTRLRREEAEAWALELAERQRHGIEDPTCPVATAVGVRADADAVEAWISSAAHPRAAGLRASHLHRCDR